MQAFENLEKEMRKAFDKMEEDFENHSAIFKRLEDDLKTVKVFEAQDYTEALANMRKHDSALYAAIRDAYEREQFDGNQDKHCQGMIAAVNAIYNLGYGNGYKDGAAAGKGTK